MKQKIRKYLSQKNIDASWKLEKRTTRIEIKEFPDAYCEGSSYHNNISADGKLQMKKEQYHADYVIDKPDEKIDLGIFIIKKLSLKQ